MIRVHISHGPFADSVRIWVVNHTDPGKRILHYSHDGQRLTWSDIDESSALTEDSPAPTLALPSEAGRALLDELARFYQGGEDTRALRRDYDNERKRVDEQAKVIADIARMLAQGGGHA